MWWTPDRLAYAVSYLVNNGLSPWGAAALVSRWVNVESSGGPPSVNPKSGAFGIAQWLGPRRPSIYGDTNFDDQLAYVVQELNSSERRAGVLLRTATDAYSGARAATAYERAEDWNAGTNTDRWTARTAVGAASVLQNWQGVASMPIINNGEGIQNAFDVSQFQDFTPNTTSGIGISGVAVAAAAAFVLFLILDW
jgi:hypothetical protein